MARLNHQGTVLLVTVFLLVIASLLLTAWLQIQQLNIDIIGSENIDSRRAEQIMAAGLDIGIYTWQANPILPAAQLSLLTIAQQPLLGG